MAHTNTIVAIMVLFAIGVASDEVSCGNTGTFTCYYNNYVLNIITDSNLGTTCAGGTCITGCNTHYLDLYNYDDCCTCCLMCCSGVSTSTHIGGTGNSTSIGGTGNSTSTVGTGNTNSTRITSSRGSDKNYSLLLLFVILTSLVYPLDASKMFE